MSLGSKILRAIQGRWRQWHQWSQGPRARRKIADGLAGVLLSAALALAVLSSFRPAAASDAIGFALLGFAGAALAHNLGWGWLWLLPVLAGFITGGVFGGTLTSPAANTFYTTAATVIPVLLIPLVFQLPPQDHTTNAPIRFSVRVAIALLVLGETSALITTAHARTHNLPLVAAALAAGLVGLVVAALPQAPGNHVGNEEPAGGHPAEPTTPGAELSGAKNVPPDTK